jgi:ABC-type transport system involved in multi-copper enzyme maturation permease subunit
MLSLLGLVYLTAFVATRGTSDELAYRVGLAVGVVGLLALLWGLGRSLYPVTVNFFRNNNNLPEYHVPFGILFILVGLIYLGTALGICSDNRVVVLTRRELAAFFFSPIAYIVLFAFTVAHGLAYFMTLLRLMGDRVNMEPVVSQFILQWPPIFCIVFLVPALTMRLLSEERRTGTLEVMLTTPVDEGGVVISKFLAAFLMYLFIWLPFGFYLVALRLMGGEPFDYRPLLSFAVALCATGAGFVSMGLFFSSLTRNQITSGVLTFAGMLTLTLVFLIKMFLVRDPMETSAWAVVLKHVSYIDVWIDSLEGKLVPKFLLFHVSATALWLFLTAKVLEARKWL